MDDTANIKNGVSAALIEATATDAQTSNATVEAIKNELKMAPITVSAPKEPEIVSRLASSGTGRWGINVGHYPSRYAAEKMLLKTALAEMSTLSGSTREVIASKLGFDANFTGLNEASAERACQRLRARNVECSTVGPG